MRGKLMSFLIPQLLFLQRLSFPTKCRGKLDGICLRTFPAILFLYDLSSIIEEIGINKKRMKS